MIPYPLLLALLLLLGGHAFLPQSLAAQPAPPPSAQPPNIILIISDDQGFGDYGFMGHPQVRTPHLDRMASQSLLYTRGYVMPVCSPSLACLLTGRMPHENGITGNDLSKAQLASLPKESTRTPLVEKLLSNPVLLPKALAQAGYLTLQTGKLWNVVYQDVGFTHGMTDKTGRHGGDGLAIGRKSMQPIYDFIEQAQAQKKPFFVWYAPMMPHDPHTPPPDLLAHYQGKGLSPKAEKYYGMVEWFDQTCGELDAYLQRQHLAENTLILYLTDNGWDADKGYAGDRAKLSPYELGIRTPMFIRWPGKVAPRRDEETLASILDFVPTILKASGSPMPPLPGLDLLDSQAMSARKTVHVEAYTHDIHNLEDPAQSLLATVTISGWSKLITPTGRQDTARPFAGVPAQPALFDLKQDPLEKADLAAQRPEEVQRLQALQDAAWNPRAKR
ncbi:MAG: Arylsulfatase [Verrucomicrobiota bacterium]